jgi:alkanesulfonate monooxygenase SsuD/methylene tetrahydromethanopterin reductase-like flavin-dependent oxidoreductase (luciferase family)
VGVGGDGAQDFEAAGVPLAERGSRADEGIAALRRLFADRPASFSGFHYRFQDVSIEPAPVQPGGPPILVGGRSHAAQRRAGTLGDGWLPYLVSPRTFAAGVETVRAHALAVDRDPTELRHGVVAFARVSDDGARAREAAREHLSHRYGMRFEPYHVEHLCVAGTPEECSARVQAYADAGASHLALNPAVDGDGFLSQVELLRTIVAPAREVRT